MERKRSRPKGRAELRLRDEAAQSAVGPITFLQAILAVCGVGIACAVIVGAWMWFAAGFDGIPLLKIFLLDARAGGASTSTLFKPGVPFALALGTCLIVGPIAVYLALSGE